MDMGTLLSIDYGVNSVMLSRLLIVPLVKLGFLLTGMVVAENWCSSSMAFLYTNRSAFISILQRFLEVCSFL